MVGPGETLESPWSPLAIRRSRSPRASPSFLENLSSNKIRSPIFELEDWSSVFVSRRQVLPRVSAALSHVQDIVSDKVPDLS
jgi:hypothetical protein